LAVVYTNHLAHIPVEDAYLLHTHLPKVAFQVLREDAYTRNVRLFSAITCVTLPAAKRIVTVPRNCCSINDAGNWGSFFPPAIGHLPALPLQRQGGWFSIGGRVLAAGGAEDGSRLQRSYCSRERGVQ
jgi:hypothetical protein